MALSRDFSTRLTVWSSRFFVAGLILHTVYIPFDLLWDGPPYLTQTSETYGVLVWTVAMGYFFLARQARWQVLSVVILPALTVLQLRALLLISPVSNGLAQDGSWYLPVHLLIALVSVAIFFLAFVSGIFLLYQESSLKQRKLSGLSLQLPSIPSLQKGVTRLLRVGFFLLTLTVASGLLLETQDSNAGMFVVTDAAHRWWSFAAWILYGLVLQMRHFRPWHTRNWLGLSLLGFLVIGISFLEVHG